MPGGSVPQQRQWRLTQSQLPAQLSGWAEELGVSLLTAGLLWRRGLESLGGMDVFLSPGLRHLAHYSQLPGLEDSARVLAQGIEAGLPMAVWGDYDVDGVTSTALVIDTLARRGITAKHHIPDRRTEGYGLNPTGIERLAADGVRLLLTVDCGISAAAALGRAQELGITVVVSDHHIPGAEPTPAQAVVNPRLSQGHPFEDLAGVGVAFLLMAAVNRLLPGEPLDMRPALDLVALGSLADMVRLTGQNRILVKNGMLLLSEAARPGIFALKEAAGLSPSETLGAGRVLFGLAPRINAAGRLGQAEIALRLLLAKDRAEARPLANQLETMNSERKAAEERIHGEAMAQAQELAANHGLVLAGEDWHPGVIGIVASRVVEAMHRPVLILTRDPNQPGRYKGSGRSIDAFDLHGGLANISSLLAGFGGHRQAAGLSVDAANLAELRAVFHEEVLRQLGTSLPSPSLRVDADLPLGAVDLRLLKELALLQPYGPGNPEPVFQCTNAQLRGRRAFGKNHLSLEVHDPLSRVTMRAKAWRQAEHLPPSLVGQSLSLAFCPKRNTYQGLDSIELHLKDWRVAG